MYSKNRKMYDIKVNTVRICVVLAVCLLLVISYQVGLYYSVYPHYHQQCSDDKQTELLELFDRAVNSCDLIIVAHTEDSELPPVPSGITIPVGAMG